MQGPVEGALLPSVTQLDPVLIVVESANIVRAIEGVGSWVVHLRMPLEGGVEVQGLLAPEVACEGVQAKASLTLFTNLHVAHAAAEDDDVPNLQVADIPNPVLCLSERLLKVACQQ